MLLNKPHTVLTEMQAASKFGMNNLGTTFSVKFKDGGHFSR